MSKFIELLEDLPPDFYSYLLSKTKAEKELLEFLGFQIEQKTQLVTKVEYTDKVYNCSRMDLAVLDSGLVPLEVIEAKFYYSFDGCFIHDSQLGSEVEKDIEKMGMLPDSISKFFVLFLVHFDSEIIPELFPYSNTHNKVMKRFQSADDLRWESSRVTLDYLRSKGLNVELREIAVGRYDGIPVILQVFLCAVK